MAKDTPFSYRNLVIYEIYVRNHTPNGTFNEVKDDLPRLKQMGVDIIWFMPIHPIGQLNKKGALGCPYSIRDYRGINPEYGTRQDFSRLLETAHKLGLKVMIDVVYNHTSHDSILVQEHPDWFHQDKHGKPVTTVAAWTDVIDFKHPNPELTRYLIDTLKDWAQFGVDGFRCDVASVLPLDFWIQARSEVAKVKPGVIWLAESVHASFITHRRLQGLLGNSDCELFEAFDILYDYEIWSIWQNVVTGNLPLVNYTDVITLQDSLYPINFAKMRCVENHDNARIMRLAPSHAQAIAWTAFQAFNKGPLLIYAGQEAGAVHTPSLFEIDKIAWGKYELQPYITRLAVLKKDAILINGNFTLVRDDALLQAMWYLPTGESLYGIFNVAGRVGQAKVDLPDGVYQNVLDDGEIKVVHGQLDIRESAAIFKVKLSKPPKSYTSAFFHYDMPPEMSENS
jgi:hypothetical protein